MEGEGVLNKRVAQRWFQRFNTGEENTKSFPRSRRPKLCNIENTQSGRKYATSTRRLPEEPDASKDIVHRQTKTLGKSYRSCKSVPHELTPKQVQRRVDMSSA